MKFYVGLMTGLLFSCSPPQNQRTNRLEMLAGTWYAKDYNLYHTIYVQDSTHIALDTHIDTTFFYEYKLLGDTLALYKPHGELVNHNRILLLTADTLVLEALLDRDEILAYSRRRRVK